MSFTGSKLVSWKVEDLHTESFLPELQIQKLLGIAKGSNSRVR